MDVGEILSEGETAVSGVSKILNGWYVYAAIGAVMFGLGFAAAWKIQNGIAAEKEVAQQAAVIAAGDKARKEQQAQDKVTHDVDVAAALKQQKIITVTVETIKQVPVYVTKKADSACRIPAGFVRLYDGAARGVSLSGVPQSPGQPDGAVSASGYSPAR